MAFYSIHMTDIWFTIKTTLLLIAGISAIMWVVVKVVFKFYLSKKHDVTYGSIEMPPWYNVLFWVILLFLVVANLLFYLT